MAAVRKAFSFGTDLWDPSQRFETSWLLPPLVLFAARLAFVSFQSSPYTTYPTQAGRLRNSASH